MVVSPFRKNIELIVPIRFFLLHCKSNLNENDKCNYFSMYQLYLFNFRLGIILVGPKDCFVSVNFVRS